MSVDAVREQVLQLARQIEQLCGSDVGPDQFYPQFIDLLGKAVGAEAVAVWLLDENRQITLATDVGLDKLGLADAPAALTANHYLLADALGTGQTMVFHPDQPNNSNNARPLPVNKQIILSPLKIARDCVGVVEVFQRAETAPESRRGFMQFVERMSAAASQYLARHRTEQTRQATDKDFVELFSRYLYGLQRGRKLSEVASVAASDGRLLLEADRVSVVVRRGRKTEVLAVSGQEKVHPRANLVRTMRTLAQSVIASGQPLVYTGSQADWPPDVEEKLSRFVEEGRARMILMLPVKEPPKLLRADEEEERQGGAKTAEEGKTFGCLVIEQMSTSDLSPRLKQRVDMIAGHVAAALFAARTQERIFGLRLWRSIGGLREWLVGRRLVKTLLVLAAVLLVTLAMVLIPWDYRVSGEGRLMPIRQEHVFAPWEGDVVELYVKGGELVEQGQKLLKIRNKELESEKVKIETDLSSLRKRHSVLLGQMGNSTFNPDGLNAEKHKFMSERLETAKMIEGLQQRLDIIDDRLARLTVRAPKAGRVATFQLEQKLGGRPVSRDDMLLEIMDETGPWRLEVDVPDDRFGHLIDGTERLGTEHLPVEYILATRPEATYDGSVSQFAHRTEASDEALVVPVFVEIDPEDLADEDRRIGAEVQAKINCGQRSLGYCLFGDVIEFFQRQFWL